MRAKEDTMNKLPNGWPHPTFMSVDDGGALNVEWCGGAGDNRWRIMFVWDPEEGATSCHTTRGEQRSEEGAKAGIFLAELLEAAKAETR